jgi:uncharacterized protein (UPF0297 family)
MLLNIVFFFINPLDISSLLVYNYIIKLMIGGRNMSFDKTLTNIDPAELRERALREEYTDKLLEIHHALCEKGYNPTAQLIGYILTEDPTYITTHNNARVTARKLDRHELLKFLLEDFIKNHQVE